MSTYYVKFRMGCTLVEAEDEECAEAYVRRKYGTYSEPIEAREASEHDKAWVTGMGGRTHKARKSC
jgi:hypothetical protein